MALAELWKSQHVLQGCNVFEEAKFWERLDIVSVSEVGDRGLIFIYLTSQAWAFTEKDWQDRLLSIVNYLRQTCNHLAKKSYRWALLDFSH